MMNTKCVLCVSIMALAIAFVVALPVDPDTVVPEADLVATGSAHAPVHISETIHAMYDGEKDEQVLDDAKKEDHKSNHPNLLGTGASGSAGSEHPDGLQITTTVNDEMAANNHAIVEADEEKAEIEQEKSDAENKAEMDKADAQARIEQMKEMAQMFPDTQDEDDTVAPKRTYKVVWEAYQKEQAEIKAAADKKAAEEEAAAKKFEAETQEKAAKMSSCMAGHVEDCE